MATLLAVPKISWMLPQSLLEPSLTNLVRRDLDAAVRVVVLDDGFRQERGSPALGRSRGTSPAFALIVDRLVHGLDADLRQRLRDIADAEADDVGIRVRFLVGSDTARNLREEIAARQLQIVIINGSHRMKSSS